MKSFDKCGHLYKYELPSGNLVYFDEPLTNDELEWMKDNEQEVTDYMKSHVNGQPIKDIEHGDRMIEQQTGRKINKEVNMPYGTGRGRKRKRKRRRRRRKK